ncbi:MAG: hypothetical protein HY236_09485 [Acidobacteria bacterium]|nr:hypothetical protein [Acidobacteriota bacterium]
MLKTTLFTLLLLVAAFPLPAVAQTPNVGDNGVVNGASFVPFGQPGHPTAPGSIVSIFGTNFASAPAGASTVPLSTSLGGVRVFFNGKAAPLFFVSSGQINAQLPWELAGTTASVVVTNSAGSSLAKTIQTNQISPAIFSANQQGNGQGAVLFSNTRILAAPVGIFPGTESRPAKAGDVLTIYCNGLGPVTPSVTDGHNTLDGLRSTTIRPTVTVGGVTVPDIDVLFSGLAPQFVGLNQIDFRLPPGVASGSAIPIRITVAGVESRPDVTIAVQ